MQLTVLGVSVATTLLLEETNPKEKTVWTKKGLNTLRIAILGVLFSNSSWFYYIVASLSISDKNATYIHLLHCCPLSINLASCLPARTSVDRSSVYPSCICLFILSFFSALFLSSLMFSASNLCRRIYKLLLL